MQRVSALLPSWDRSKANNNNITAATTTSTLPAAANPARRTPLALDKVFGWAEKITAPGSRLSFTGNTSPAPTSYGRETYWPATLDKECDKAARILKSFCSKPHTTLT